MNRAISGTVVAEGKSRPLPGLIILAGRLQPGGVDLLGWTVSGTEGAFRIQYHPIAEPVDLVLFVYRPDGALLLAEPPHRSILGAELQLRVEVPICQDRSCDPTGSCSV